MSDNQQFRSFQGLDMLSDSVIWRRRFAFALLLWGRFWPLASPVILLFCVFLSCAWFGIFSLLPAWLHGVLLLFFVLVTFGLLSRFLTLRLPLSHEIYRHIEQRSGLAFQPLLAQSDGIVLTDGIGAVLWQEHQRRMRERLQNLRIGMPAPQIPKRDPYALRSLVFLIFFIAFAYSFSPRSGHLGDAFSFSSGTISPQLMRIDGWIDSPDYTGMAPIYLNFDEKGDKDRRTVPYNSVVHFRIVNARDTVRLWKIDKDLLPIAVAPVEPSPEERATLYHVPLTEDTHLQLAASSQEKNWGFTIIADQAPQIKWVEKPRRALNGTLEVAYQIDDDYGAIKAWAEMRILEQFSQEWEPVLRKDKKPEPLTESAQEKDTLQRKKASRALYEAPQFSLILPRGGKGTASHRQNLTNHPWAGMEVEIILYIEDGAGQIGASAPLTLTLPQRVFGNPLARAVIEQRRLLIQDSNHKDRVADMLAALLVRPQDTILNAAHVIALQSAWTRLSYIDRHDDENLRAMADYLWQIALGIEDDGLNAAHRRLKQAQQALRDALREGASEQEIARLMQDLRQAMQDYIAALADAQARNALSAEVDEKQLLRNDDLEKKLKQLEEMANLGARGAAEQLLSELENLLDNLQIVQNRGGEGQSGRSERSAMQQNMDNLADMLRRQQEMMNETDRLTQEWLRGEHDDENYRKSMEKLAQQQEGLRNEWKGLTQSLQQQGVETGEAMGEAEQEMGQAQHSLDHGDGISATGSQGRALDSMRRAGQSMMQAMREEMGEQSGQSDNVDPLGRERPNGQASHGSNVKVPTEMDVEKTRRILDEIRARLGQITPQLERQYLERLLEFN